MGWVVKAAQWTSLATPLCHGCHVSHSMRLATTCAKGNGSPRLMLQEQYQAGRNGGSQLESIVVRGIMSDQ
jgi:hypothetical protein